MPKFNASNLAAIDPEYRKANNIGSGGNNSKSRYAYGKQNNVLIAAGGELLGGGLCLRLLPMYDEARDAQGNRMLANFREGRDDIAFGDWCRVMTCAHWAGNPGMCFIVHNGDPDVNLYDSPLHVLRKVAYDASKDNPHPTLGRLFSELLSKEFVRNSHIGSLKKPEKTMFISASTVYVDDTGKVVLGAFSDDPKRNARIIGLKTSAGEAFHSALGVRNEAGKYLSGDMLGFDAAKLFTILPESFNSGSQNVIAVSAAGPATFQCPKFARSASKDAEYIVGFPHSRSEYTHFGILHDTFNGQAISLEPYAERIVAETQTWDDYLRLPSYEEQAEMIAPLFPREALDYAWREFPAYLRAVPRNTSTFEGVNVSVEELAESHVVKRTFAQTPTPPQAAQRPKAAPAPDPVAPWDMQSVADSPEHDAGVAELFSAIPPGATVAPPKFVSAPQGTPPAAPVSRSPAEVLARAKAHAAKK